MQTIVFDDIAGAGLIAANRARLRRRFDASTRRPAAGLADFRLVRFHRFTIPLRIAEMMMRPNKVINREVVLAVKQPSASANDLLELDYGAYRAHQHDVAHVAGIHAR